jgi:hypothetical protein
MIYSELINFYENFRQEDQYPDHKQMADQR